ncbi:1,2-phenylacetyl-CoA epoxidase subunit PaaD [Halosimplex pelagicum]|uniref:Metal-sulfur cluster assembly factor n=1 Tax=Halosimplex pelagicum TaxID=869886 RepID=A0A7D5TWK4_9EURY|nr:1,2-phenylacetyl-CoA epoxidase subunit PaaD [Halosimplex pelagicum]QLH84154.1 metal-sulfur cluster assembly factor [Halosimplex pelagicum]
MNGPYLGSDSDRGTDDDAADPDPTACAYTTYRDTKSGSERELPATGADATGAEARVWTALREVEDPEMPVSVVDLGLIYGVAVDDGAATVEMTLTYTGCPARAMLTDDIERAAESADGVDRADVRLVWSPEWTLEMVTEDGKAALREFGVSV